MFERSIPGLGWHLPENDRGHAFCWTGPQNDSWVELRTNGAGERRFEFRVPPSPAASLELELPVGEVPAVPSAEVLLTGPFPVAGEPPRAAWQVRFGSRSRFDLALRPAGNPGVTALTCS